MYMRSTAISIPKNNTTVSIIGMRAFVSSCPTRSILYGSPSDSYIPLQHHPMPSSSCPENVEKTQTSKQSPHYLSSDSEAEDAEEAFDGTFDPSNPIVAQIFENVAIKLFEESQN